MARYRVLLTVTVQHSAWREVDADSVEIALARVANDIDLSWESEAWQNTDGKTGEWSAEWDTAFDLEATGDVEEVEP